MVQMVFVHGVSVRRDDANPGPYDLEVAERDGRFKGAAFKGAGMDIRNPYWGKFGAPAEYESIPKLGGSTVALGGLGGGLGGGVAAGPDNQLVEMAKADFAAVVSSLSIVAEGLGAQSAQEATFWAAAGEYAAGYAARPAVADRIPNWLKGPGAPATDEAFLTRLRAEVKADMTAKGRPGAEALGLFDGLKKAADELVGKSSNFANRLPLKAARALSPKVAIFLGDVFRYLKGAGGGHRDSIRKTVLDDILAAAKAAKQNGEPLVLAGHSMGCIILYDMLSDPAVTAKLSQDLGAPFKADLLLTIGTQIGLFEELKSFQSSQPGITPPAKVPKPACVARWWNVYDKMDVLSFYCGPIFADVEDFEMDTVSGVFEAHGAYFKSSVFYARLNARLKAEGLAP